MFNFVWFVAVLTGPVVFAHSLKGVLVGVSEAHLMDYISATQRGKLILLASLSVLVKGLSLSPHSGWADALPLQTQNTSYPSLLFPRGHCKFPEITAQLWAPLEGPAAGCAEAM